ncbi:hypothetical protein ACH5RR_036258 [Cinchona calisaya]|uniref:Sec-independent protein translocase protein TATC, chloroplastic n=1 Tax=Cinchona calisaya TaxID=153742 RepID=A0ABD2Y2N7_9GENT
MGSTSAGPLIHNLHLKSTNHLKCLNSSNTISRTSFLVNNRREASKLKFLSRKEGKKFSRVVCCALEEDVTDKKQQEFSGSIGSAVEDRPGVADGSEENLFKNDKPEDEGSSLYNFLYPSKELLPDDKEMSMFDHLEELRQRIFVSVLAIGAAILGCFAYSKELIVLLEAPVRAQGVRFLQLAPGEFFFTTLKVAGYCGLLLGSPIILYEIIAFVLPGLTQAERRFLGPIVLGSSVLFYSGIVFSYYVLAPAALNFFVSYAEGVVESLWSIDQYFEFVLVLMFSTGLSFQVPVIQLLLGQVGLVSGDQMLSIWRYVVVGSVVVAAVLTPSTDPLTQLLLAAPLLGLYLGGAWMVKFTGG